MQPIEIRNCHERKYRQIEFEFVVSNIRRIELQKELEQAYKNFISEVEKQNHLIDMNTELLKTIKELKEKLSHENQV